MIHNTRLEQKENIIIVDFELHKNQLLLPIYNVETNIYEIFVYHLNKGFTTQDRDNLLKFFQSNTIYVFKEGKFLDALFHDDNFLHGSKYGVFNLDYQQIRDIKKQFSSNRDGMKISYLEGLPFFSTYNFIPTPAGDLKVIAFKLNNNLKQKHSTFGMELEALNYCRINIKMIYELYKYAIVQGKDVSLLHSENCYGTIVNINGIGIVSPRILGEYGMWINSSYYYIKLNNPNITNIDLKPYIRELVETFTFNKHGKIDTFLEKISSYGELL
jgi:hypothetical protein